MTHPAHATDERPSLTQVVIWLTIASTAVTLNLWIRGENGEKKAIYAFEPGYVAAEIRFVGWSNIHRVELERWRRDERSVVPLVVIAPWRAVSIHGMPESVAKATRALGSEAAAGATSATVVLRNPHLRSFEIPSGALRGLRSLTISSTPFSLAAIGVAVVHESAITTPGFSPIQRDMIAWSALVSSCVAFYFVLTQRRRWWLLAVAPPLALTTPALFTSFVVTVPWITFGTTMTILISGLSLFRPGSALPPVEVHPPGATPHDP